MTKRRVALACRAAALWLAACAAACAPANGPNVGTQTNWLTLCRSDAECGELQCLCGACTRSCSDEPACGELPGASCVAAEDSGAIALCGGSLPACPGLCLVPCPDEGCAGGTSCVAGVCMPTPEQTALVSVDESQRFQTLVGFGAGIGYVFDEIARHPRKEALFDALFSGTGLNVLRPRNLHVPGGGEDLSSSAEIVTAAAKRLGQSPIIILNSASPPGSLKANGSSWCEGNPDTCTLARLPDGSFDYAGFASHWRASLDAYALAGMVPDYISIQNNPNFVPGAGRMLEACRFLPTQGTATVTTGAGVVDVEYPGYAEALAAVMEQLAGLDSIPKIAAPETSGFMEVADFISELDIADVDAIAHHLYGTDATNVDRARLEALGELAEQNQRPLFQSEMGADALTTAVLMHAALAIEGAVLYLQTDFVGSVYRIEPDRTTLVNLTDDDFVIEALYHVMLHYSAHVEPGWVRVAASSDTDGLLASAWVSPGGDAVTVVLTNPELTETVVRIDAGADAPTASTVTRTVLGGRERSAELGPLPPEGIVRLPGHSLVTVTIQR
jgi:glucuronoarabinoxylan endo-1,4-beta-xylanase